ncbi:2'-5'-oligoadenylate synthase 1-like isoform X2 [Ptychodera flava]|uniref:2'-5'-oligoadenylate synthase 1-like isoform X2 n=1 Tax=Ptychodera flava TaxID=63121 RepID=UPI00396A4FB6
MYPYGASARPIMAASFLAVSPSVSYLNENKDFLQQAPRDLDKFISNNLQPTTEVNYMARDKVKRLVNFHQHNFGYSVKEVVVSGSFGKGTQVKGFADLDCVLILNDIKDHKELKAAGKDMFKNLEEVLRKSTFATITDMKKTRFALQFDLEVNGEKMGVDLLPTFDTSSRDARRRRSLYQEILQCTRADRQFYSAALCHLQIEFIKKQPTKLKNLIRLVKYWNKTVVKPQAKTTPALRYPSSYPLELISIYVCEKIGDKESFDMAAAFKAVMQQVVDYKKIIAVWHDNYDEQMADKGMREMERPILLDPANPTNNVLSASDEKALEHVAQIAKETLMKPLLLSVSLPF